MTKNADVARVVIGMSFEGSFAGMLYSCGAAAQRQDRISQRGDDQCSAAGQRFLFLEIARYLL
jgi:hypothetical protein